MGLVPKQTKTEIKIIKGLTRSRFFGLTGSILFGAFAGKYFVHRYLYVFFIIFCVGVYLVASAKSHTNPKKSFWNGLISYITFSRSNKSYYGNNTDEYIKSKEYFNEQKNKREEKRKGNNAFNLFHKNN